jgi:hypothetical protein
MLKELKDNFHIENYLTNYLQLDKPEFAILLTGKWGSGKTYFIDKFIENNQKKDEIKFIKISLFGLKEIDAIDEQIFQNLHPFLGNKYVKLTGSVLKSAVKFGFKLDWNSDNKSDGNASVDTSKINLLEWFSGDKESKEKLIFVFDDLERTDIELTEILGYINYFVEQSGLKVIILANEEKLKKDDDSNKYKDFKEKVIGKTFEVKHNFEQILISIISEKANKSKHYLNENKSIIQDVYYKAKQDNIRHIKQIILDFEYFIEQIDDKYLKNSEFVSILVNNFFALSIELKSATLTEDELSEVSNILIYLSSDGKEKSKTDEVYEKYKIKSSPIFSGKVWVKIISKNSMTKEEINKIISELSFFIKEKEKPSWVKLWHYRELKNSEFQEAKKDVLDKFKNCSYEIPEHFLHVVALLIYFNKNGLCDLNLDEINDQVKECIEGYKKTIEWTDSMFTDRMRFNGTGLAYMGEDNQEFKELFNLILEENKKVYEDNKKVKERVELDDFLEAIKKGNVEFVRDLLIQKYSDKPIFKNLSVKDFFQLLSSIDNKNLTELRYILGYRYGDERSLNGKKYYSYLIEELSFWNQLKDELEKCIKEKDSTVLHTVLLKEFRDYCVKNIIEKMKSCINDQPNQ